MAAFGATLLVSRRPFKFHRRATPRKWIGGVGTTKECQLNVITSTSDWMERYVFSADDKGVRTVASHIIALAAVGTNRRTATSNWTDHACTSQVQLSWFVVIIYRVTFVFLCGVSFISVVEPQFLLYPLSYGVPVRERYGSTLLPATREQHDQNCTQSH